MYIYIYIYIYTHIYRGEICPPQSIDHRGLPYHHTTYIYIYSIDLQTTVEGHR